MRELIVPFHDSRPESIRVRSRLLHVDQNARRRQIFEQMRGSLEKQRQVELQPPRRAASAHVPVDGVLGQIAGEAQSVTAPEFAHRVRAQRRFARGQQVNPLQLFARSLRVGVEKTDAVDIAVEQIDPVRAFRAHREDIEQRSPHGELAVRRDLRHCGIARERQPLAQGVQIQRLADVNLQGMRLDVAARSKTLHQGVDRDHPDAAPRARQFRQSSQPCRGDVRVRREAVVRQRLEVGEHVHRHRSAREESDLLAQRFSGARGLGNDDQRPRGFGRRLGDGERGGRAIELAPFDEGGCGGRQERVE